MYPTKRVENDLKENALFASFKRKCLISPHLSVQFEYFSFSVLPQIVHVFTKFNLIQLC